MLRALIALAFCATAICGVKGSPRPPETRALEPGDAGAPRDGGADPFATDMFDRADPADAIDPADPLERRKAALDAGCSDGGR